MDNLVMILIMVIASIVINPFLSAKETKSTKHVATTDSSDEEDSDDDAVIIEEEETESD